MATVTLTPDATTTFTGTVTGAANAHTALSDSSDSSYVEFNSFNETWDGGLSDLTLPAGAKLKSVALRVRAQLFSGGDYGLLIAGVTVAGTRHSNSLVLNWAVPTTVTFLTLNPTSLGLTDSNLDAATVDVIHNTVAPVSRVFEVYLDVTYVALPVTSADEPTGTVTTTNIPSVIWTPS